MLLRDLWFQSELSVDVIESKRVLFLLQNLRERLIDTHPLSRWVHHLPPRPGERGVNVGVREGLMADRTGTISESAEVMV